MMWRSVSALATTLLLLAACREKRNEVYSHRYPGYYYRLLSFSSDSFTYRPNAMALVAASFKTQSDSVFWDSFNNLADRFYFRIDSGASDNFIRHYISTASVYDSACLLIKPADFFRQQFGSDSIPFFSKNDSVVKVELKLKKILSQAEFEKLESNLRRLETEQVEGFFGSPAQLEQALDPAGFYWISRPEPSGLDAIEEGDQVLLSYTGHFLNGRLFENSASHFEYIYGTPDQLLKGLNYATGKLKLGQTAKILLPSRLAFGENGSSNGVVPPYTPLIYELKIIDVKKIK
jgi:FKBP-type peptidyl-prolyl cis-trans isomerase FkpA